MGPIRFLLQIFVGIQKNPVPAVALVLARAPVCLRVAEGFFSLLLILAFSRIGETAKSHEKSFYLIAYRMCIFQKR